MADAPSKPVPPSLDGPEKQSRGENFLKIKWNAATNAVRYRIKCNTQTRDFSGSNIPFKTTFSSLPHNTKHTLIVVAFNPDGDSVESDPFERYTRPIPPSDLVLVPGESSRDMSRIFLRWAPVSGVPRYQVTATPGGTQEFTPPPAAGHAFVGLDANTKYQFVVRSFDPAKGGLSLNSSPTLKVATRPPRPTRPLVAFRRPRRIIITWAALPDFPGSGVAGVITEIFVVHPDESRSRVHSSAGIGAGEFDYFIPNIHGFRIEARLVTPLTSPENISFWSEPAPFISGNEIIAHTFGPTIEELRVHNEQLRHDLLNQQFDRF